MAMRIHLKFAPSQSATTRARLEYAFRLFCAIYGHTPVLGSDEGASAPIHLSYDDEVNSSRPTVMLPPAYDSPPLILPPLPPQPYEFAGEHTVLRCALRREKPDWLGEIFEWVSCSDEYSAKTDAIGRIGFEDSYFGRWGLSPRVPYAAIAMRCLQREIVKLFPRSTLKARSPVPNRHFVINTHDVDYLPLNRFDGALRLLRNACITAVTSRNLPLAYKQAAAATRLIFRGEDLLDQVPYLVNAEQQRGLRSSFLFLCNRRHPRDGNYDIERESVLNCMRLVEQNAEIGLHASYESLDVTGGVAAEFRRMYDAGFCPRGVRQHWLRFQPPRLLAELELAGSDYDCSIGWSDVIGFRSGACFAYPPYDFREERPSTFVEIPLVMMDHAIRLLVERHENVYEAVSQLLRSSRQYGWGGVSVLWHPTAFSGGQMPPSVGKLFWSLVDEAHHYGDDWISAGDFVNMVGRRYQQAGLLPANRFPSPPTLREEHSKFDRVPGSSTCRAA